MLIDNPLKFHQDILNGSQVTERKRFVTDRQMTRAKGICYRPLKEET